MDEIYFDVQTAIQYGFFACYDTLDEVLRSYKGLYLTADMNVFKIIPAAS